MKYRSVLAHLKLVALFIIFGYLFSNKTVAQVIINEVVASNSQGVLDEDGDYPDWIELYNPTANALNLNGYGISDDASELFKFILPDIEIPANGYTLLYASDKNRGGQVNESNAKYWETVVQEGDEAKYIVPSSAVSNSWIQKEFNDTSWLNGAYGFGYGDEDDITEVPTSTISVFTRATFTVEDASIINDLMLHIDFDDGYVAYLNGVEISRNNIEGSAPIPFNGFATTYTNPLLAEGQSLAGIPLTDFKDLIVNGENVLAIQIHNNSTESSDMTLIPFLSVSRSEQPTTTRGVADKITIEENEVGEFYPHLNFKLSAAGETIHLTEPISQTTQSFSYPELRQDESYGLGVNGDTNRYFYLTPSPLSANTTQAYTERLADPVLIQKGGIYSAATPLQLVDPSTGGDIYFTVDGSEPTTSDIRFGLNNNSRSVGETFTIRFKAIATGKLPSRTVTHTYIINQNHELPVISIATEPDNLWSDESGIYVRGTNGIPGFCQDAVNWNQDWEIPINIELFEPDGSNGFNTGAGAKIFGGCSRGNDQKSLAIFFRGEYGLSELEYKVFEEKDIDKFQGFVLRNSGNDFNRTHMRDGMMKTLIEGTALDYQAFRPAVIYLNGAYWGIHNIREKVNEHFIASNSASKSDEIDLLEANSTPIHGTDANYQAFLTALGSNNLSNPTAYRIVEDMIDIENYIDYMAAQIYYGNDDWPGNNIKYWRDQGEGGKWRWIIYDTDFGFDLYKGGANHNTLSFALDPNGPDWPNPSWSTYVFRRLVTSDVFVDKFVNRMADLMNVNFEVSNVNAVIDSLSQIVEAEMPAHKERWGGNMGDWNGQIDGLRSYAQNRRSNMENYIRNQFGISSNGNIQVSTSNTAQGIVKVNRVTPNTFPWTGRYFSGIAVPLTAIPKPGFQFSHWSGSSTSTESTINGTVGRTYVANFVESDIQPSDVVVNEIMYNSSDEKITGDWIEFMNTKDFAIDVSGWVVKDNDDTHEFIIPDNTTIAPYSYLVVSADLVAFNSEYTNVNNLVGDLGFNLSGSSDQVRLYDNAGLLIDSLEYSDNTPWDSLADGTGYTLELVDATAENMFAENWSASVQMGGTPGTKNTVVVSNEMKDDVPSEILLKQNYPNPFNPSTSITFEIPKQIEVNLSVFDMLGRKVAVLVNETRSAGSYVTNWDASQQSSGVYFYRLEVGTEAIMKKMLLIK